MKKIIFASQRVDINKDYHERRDALDQQWAKLLWQTDCLLVPIPNHYETVEILLANYRPEGILLTGGNNPVLYNGDAEERDRVDHLLIDYAVNHKIPLLGVCRGMQSVVLHFGGSLKPVEGHIAVKHMVSGKFNREVNSFHALASDVLPDIFEILASSSNGEIESIRHKTLPITAIMWHPERVSSFSLDDIKIIEDVYNKRSVV